MPTLLFLMGKQMGLSYLVSQAVFGRVRKQLIQVLHDIYINQLIKQLILIINFNLPLLSKLYEPLQVLQVVSHKKIVVSWYQQECTSF